MEIHIALLAITIAILGVTLYWYGYYCGKIAGLEQASRTIEKRWPIRRND